MGFKNRNRAAPWFLKRELNWNSLDYHTEVFYFILNSFSIREVYVNITILK